MRLSLSPAAVPKGARAYLLAVALTGGTVLAAWAIDPSSPTRPLFVLFVFPIVLSARHGLGPGLFAGLLSAVATGYFSLPSRWIQWVLSCLLGIAVAAVIAAEHRLRRRGVEAQEKTRNLLARQLQVSAMQAEATRFQRFAQDAPIGIAFIGSDGIVQFANGEYLRIVGRSRAEFEAERFRFEPSAAPEWLHPDLGERHEAEYVRGDGTRVPVLVGVSRHPDGVAAFVVDLTAEKAAQRARQESEERYRVIAEKLKEADRRKDDFLSVLSHELRNPLAPIRNAVYVLGRCNPTVDHARREKMLGVIERQVNHLTALVDDLLDVTRITRGKIELRRERIDLNEMLRRTGEDHRAIAQDRGLDLRVSVPAEVLWVNGDPTRLIQIVGNLLQNAVKFSRSGGQITLELLPDGDSAEIHVTDAGVGIDPKLLAHVFEPFVQAERTLARSDGGLGLGLALVKALTEMHGGSVRATSRGPGKGAEFVVRLPLAATEEQPGHAAPRGAPQPSQHCSRVLVVEDNLEVAESLRDLVTMFGYQVEIAHTGPAAIAKAREHPPDVVLCDIGLPGMSGYDVARVFRGDPALQRARLVAVTGYAQPEDRRQAAEAGFDRHVAKPADPDELERLLAS